MSLEHENSVLFERRLDANIGRLHDSYRMILLGGQVINNLMPSCTFYFLIRSLRIWFCTYSDWLFANRSQRTLNPISCL